jgi:acetolactate synthase-1/2/3 large subunit
MFNRPVFLIGAGCKGNPKLLQYIGSLGIPVLTTWMAIDCYDENHPSFCGRPGIYGQRAANIIQQKATIIFCLGVRLDNEQIAYSYENFAPNAIKMVFDIDRVELDKLPTDWTKEQVDLSSVFLDFSGWTANPEWMKWCKELYNLYRPELDGVDDEYFDVPSQFITALSWACKSTDVLAIGSSGNAAVSFLQGFKIKEGQIVTNVSTIGSMGADIPMAIGACVASGKRRTICVTGDGGFMMNMQELELVTRYHLPIKFFIYNNNGYGSIRLMQDARFNGRYVGCDPRSGMTLPNIEAIAEMFNIPYYFGMDVLYENLLFTNSSPLICELSVDPYYKQAPRVSSYMDENGKFSWASMENMRPKLDDAEFEKIMKY